MTARGKLVVTILVLVVFGIGAWQWLGKMQNQPPQGGGTPAGDQPAPAARDASAIAGDLIAAATEVPSIGAPGIYQIKDNTIDIELSEYAGYAGLIVANGGLAPGESSVFFKKHGFKVRLTLSEEESWPALNSGKLAASATTVDVLAVYGRQFQVIVPAQIGFSRGADGVVVRSDIKRINDLKGRIVVTSQFTEAEFFIRYLAQEANLPVRLLPDPKSRPEPDALNLVFTEVGLAAGDVFLRDLQQGTNVLAGCVTWAPKTTEVVEKSAGKARILVTNANLLIVADILVVNKAFAQQNPAILAGLVDGLLEGNRMVRDNQKDHIDGIAKAFKWTAEDARAELAKVHLANLPESLAFFSGSIDAAGSFGGIYQSAVLAYGKELLPNPADGDRFLDLTALKAAEQSGAFKDQKISIAPIRSGAAGSLEINPLLSKNIRFLFQPNSAALDLADPNNLKDLEAIKELLKISPGSTVLLRGHVDNALIDEFRTQGGEQFVRQMALKAMDLSKNRANEIKRLLVEKHGVEGTRVEVVGRGWEDPLGSDNDANRRVEVQWFTVE